MDDYKLHGENELGREEKGGLWRLQKGMKMQGRGREERFQEGRKFRKGWKGKECMEVLGRHD